MSGLSSGLKNVTRLGIYFNPLDKRTTGIRSFLARVTTPKMLATGKAELDVKVMETDTPPHVIVTFIGDEKLELKDVGNWKDIDIFEPIDEMSRQIDLKNFKK